MDENAPSISLPDQKNIVKFFKSFDVAQIVCIKVNKSKFLVNSVLLVLHSPVFEELIYGGAEEIVLDESLQFPDADTVLHQCLLYLYGDTVNISLKQIPKIYLFATLYKIKSLQKQCEQTFIEHLTTVEKYMELLSEWSSNGRGIRYKDLIIKNSVHVIMLMTSPKAFPTILKIIRSESNIHYTFSISAMLPCQDMLDSFYTIMTKKITEPSDAIQLNLIKNKYYSFLPFTVPSKTDENHNDDSDSNDSSMENSDLLDSDTVGKEFKSKKTEFIIEKLTSSSTVATDVSSPEYNTEVNNCNKKLADKEPHQNFDSCSKASSSCDKPTSISSSNSKSDLTSDVTQVKDFSKLESEERIALLSLCFADVIELLKTVQQQDDIRKYVKIDLALTWVHFKKYEINNNSYSKFFASFNNTILAREYLFDIKKVLWNVGASSHVIEFKKHQDETFCVSSKVMPQSYVQTRIKYNGTIGLQDIDCKLGSCKLDNHKLNIFVLLKKTWNDSATVSPKQRNGYSGQIHQQNIVHVYLLGVNEDLSVKSISLKVLTKAEIIQFCKQYPNFVLKVVYCQQLLKCKSQPSLISDICSAGSLPKEGSQDALCVDNSSGASVEQIMECVEVFQSRSWQSFSYAEFSKFIRTGYSKQSKDPKENPIYNILTTNSDFVYLCIDLFFSLVHFGKISLIDQVYRSFITAFDHSLISADFVKDVKTVFNSAITTSIPVTSKNGCKNSFSVTASLDKKSLQHSISHNGAVYSGAFESPCKMPICQNAHILDIQISLNKSESDLSVDVKPRKAGSIIHKRRILHFYLLALNSKDEATQLISLKLLSKSEVLQKVKGFHKFRLRVIFSK